MSKHCVTCGDPLSGQQKKYCSTKCNPATAQSYERQVERAMRRKIMLIDRLGGCCQQCGYDNNVAALAFHHKNPDEKERRLTSREMSNGTLEDIVIEADKCILLCHNCHTELHNPDCELEQYRNKVAAHKQTHRKSPSQAEVKTCLWCEGSYTGSNAYFCCRDCRTAYRLDQSSCPDGDELLQLKKELSTWKAVAEHYGVNTKTIRSWRKRLGLLGDHPDTKQCPQCEEYFIGDTKYCSNACYRAYNSSQSSCPSREQLAVDIDELNWCAIGRKYGVSDNAVRKWARKHGILD
jgi:predicted nucleic acid-binding Zn ribbon protein